MIHRRILSTNSSRTLEHEKKTHEVVTFPLLLNCVIKKITGAINHKSSLKFHSSKKMLLRVNHVEDVSLVDKATEIHNMSYSDRSSVKRLSLQRWMVSGCGKWNTELFSLSEHLHNARERNLLCFVSLVCSVSNGTLAGEGLPTHRFLDKTKRNQKIEHSI